jgi:hypothetical protein
MSQSDPSPSRETDTETDAEHTSGPEVGAEQLAPDDPEPKGEHREQGNDGFVLTSFGPSSEISHRGDGISVDVVDAPKSLREGWDEYADFPVARSALQIFADTVLEPGYRVNATIDGETDSDMETALNLWASNSAIHAGQRDQDLLEILDVIVKRRRGEGTEFLEKVGTESNPDALRSLMLLDPATFRQYSREDQPILIQPDDEVKPEHPTTDDGQAAAYVQYDDSLSGYDDEDPIPFTQDQLVKITYNCPPGGLWGESIFDVIGPRIDALRQKWADRDKAIHQTGHPHRIYSSETWTLEEAKRYKEAYEQGEVSSWEDDAGGGAKSFAGRIDFVNDKMEIKAVEGSVADISDAVKDDLEAIFSILPVSKFKIAYEEDINQFVVEPQQETDQMLVDKERRWLKRKFTPIFEEKADELAGGSYEGDITFSIEPDESDNPVMREGFPADNLTALASFLNDVYKSGAIKDFPPGFLAHLIGTDIEEIEEEFGWSPDEVAAAGQLDESTPAAQRQSQAMQETDKGAQDQSEQDEQSEQTERTQGSNAEGTQ